MESVPMNLHKSIRRDQRGQGWRLESQTHALSVGLSTNWVEAANSSVSSTNITVDATLGSVFYRLVYP